MKRLHSLLLTFMLGFGAATVQADIAIIGNPAGPDSLTLEQVRDIYLNRSKSLPGGQRVVPYELPETSAVREAFHKKVTGRSGAQLKAFWSQQVFTGKGQPPQELGSESAVKASVASTPGGIGYIDADLVDDSVKVLLQP
ncbi:phosphate ABC transporter substrate-binding protein [Marinobacter sp. NP-6]|uniref:phosphate ABC transporter substrate-binding protein n=1 Tax=Marinobacter sp. NP-6 TaxID=2488666 RepID=UPI001E31628C|nr:phosphate ABC transporter substrate-binding protein [Marinobacter sp. NP-6]